MESPLTQGDLRWSKRIYVGENDSQAVDDHREKHIGRVRDAIAKLFPDLALQGTGDPLSGGKPSSSGRRSNWRCCVDSFASASVLKVSDIL